ncbi:hypothetical protein GCM10008967_35770 [Bacillus carboniphilus]|uniref:DoxX family protein n=1 Tax=Bacillus carboniphilus TaxID=86663 RepID=A0ABN0WMU9_9BACI
MKKGKLAERIFGILAGAFVLCLLIQVFIAGLAIFVDPAKWHVHKVFIHLFEIIPVAMVIIAFVGKMPRWAIGQSAALVGFIFLMYFSANITPVWPWAAAAHPVLALVLFWMGIKLTKDTFLYLKRSDVN